MLTNVALLSSIDAITLIFAHWFGYTASMIIICCELMDFDGTTQLSATNLYNSPKSLHSLIFMSAAASAAGLPPFLGFWTKTAIFIKITVVSSLAYAVICALLVIYGLFFYLSYLRSVLSVDEACAVYTKTTARVGFAVVIITVINSFGFLFFDDLLILVHLLV